VVVSQRGGAPLEVHWHLGTAVQASWLLGCAGISAFGTLGSARLVSFALVSIDCWSGAGHPWKCSSGSCCRRHGRSWLIFQSVEASKGNGTLESALASWLCRHRGSRQASRLWHPWQCGIAFVLSTVCAVCIMVLVVRTVKSRRWRRPCNWCWCHRLHWGSCSSSGRRRRGVVSWQRRLVRASLCWRAMVGLWSRRWIGTAKWRLIDHLDG
jgi:hypothetical protein